MGENKAVEWLRKAEHLSQPWLTLVAASTGIVACWVTVIVICVVEVLVLPHISPGAFQQGPSNVVGRAAFRVAGCLGVGVGGYVSAWLASRAGFSELIHALVVGLVFGILGVLTAASKPLQWDEVWPILAVAVLSAMIGGWVRAWQVWRQNVSAR
jgi:hypothetical protein